MENVYIIGRMCLQRQRKKNVERAKHAERMLGYLAGRRGCVLRHGCAPDRPMHGSAVSMNFG